MALITTLQEYYEERYQALEISLMESVSSRMGREFRKIFQICMGHWQEILREACAVQEEEKIPCGYMSISFLNTSLLEGNPLFQVDFYNEEWVYGEPWMRGRMPADFLFREWAEFCRTALDDSFYVRSKLQPPAIKTLFLGTAERLVYLFSCFAKYFMKDLSDLSEFQSLKKEASMYVTCGMYLDWQERIYAVLPSLDLKDLPDNEETAFREFREIVCHGNVFRDADLRHCRFYDCTFRNCVFEQVDLSDAYFRNCHFYDTDFSQVKVAGCVWEEGIFRSCGFQDSDTQAEGDEYFAEAEMVRSKLFGLRVQGCDFSYFLLRDCSSEDVRLESTKTEHSDWKSYGEVEPDG